MTTSPLPQTFGLRNGKVYLVTWLRTAGLEQEPSTSWRWHARGTHTLRSRTEPFDAVGREQPKCGVRERFRGAQELPSRLTVLRTSSRGASLSIISSAPRRVAFSIPAGSRLALKTSTPTSGLRRRHAWV